jgi:hypothetical protein
VCGKPRVCPSVDAATVINCIDIKPLLGMGTTEEKEKRTSKKNVDGRSTSSHDNKNFRTRSVEKQGGMAFGFRKTVTAVIKPDGWMDRWVGR